MRARGKGVDKEKDERSDRDRKREVRIPKGIRRIIKIFSQLQNADFMIFFKVSFLNH